MSMMRQFLTAAYRDYIAARVLLLEDLPLQGAIQASTAIEKYFKVLLAFQGNQSSGHLKKAHFNAVRNFDPELYASLNESFLELLRRVYAYRYPDALKPGTNVVIATAEFMAELDHTALAIHGGIAMKENGKEVETSLEEAVRREDPRLFSGNHVIGSIPKQEYISAHPQLVYESRVLMKRVEIEAIYEARPGPSDGCFLRPALLPASDDGRTFSFAFRLRNPEAGAVQSENGQSA